MINLSELQNKDYWLGQMVSALEITRHYFECNDARNPINITVSNLLEDFYREVMIEEIF